MQAWPAQVIVCPALRVFRRRGRRHSCGGGRRRWVGSWMLAMLVVVVLLLRMMVMMVVVLSICLAQVCQILCRLLHRVSAAMTWRRSIGVHLPHFLNI